MSDRYAGLVDRLRGAVLGDAGATAPVLRRAVEARAAAVGGRLLEAPATVPPDVASVVDKIARHAYRVTREDIDALERAGYSEDAIFELAAAAAVGAGLARLERGLAALRGGV